MATVNQKIEQALSDLVSGNIWPLACPLETYPSQWITYVPELDAPEEFGDDRDLEWVHYIQVHWFAKGLVNYNSIRTQIRSRLKEVGFCVESFASSYDEEEYTHLVCSCSIIEEIDESESTDADEEVE